MRQPIAVNGQQQRASPVRLATRDDQVRYSRRSEYVFLSIDALDDIPAEYRHLTVLSTTGRGIVLGPRDTGHSSSSFVGGTPARALPALLAEVPRCSAQATSPVREARNPCYIHRLPTELLCAIFLMCGEPNTRFIYPRDLYMHYFKEHAMLRTYSREAVKLGRVCSRWLIVTRGCPILWTMFDVFYPRPGDIVGLKLCLKYSAGLPLSLQLEEGPVVSLRRPDVSRRLMQLVADNASRWQELSLYLLDASDILDPLIASHEGSFSCLMRASLYLWKMNRSQVRPDELLWNLLYGSRSLRTVEWWDDPYHPLHTATPPVHRLTHIGAHCIPPDHLINMLQVCSQLEVLQADVESAEFVFPGLPDAHLLPMVDNIALPRLRILMLCGMRDWSRLYNALTAPMLDRLDLSAAGVQASSIEAMLTRSSARLTMLTLHWPQPGYGDETGALLQCSPLRHLKILRYAKDDSPDNMSDDYDPRSCLPAALCIFTASFQVAEAAYRGLKARHLCPFINS